MTLMIILVNNFKKLNFNYPPCPPVDSIMILMAVWWITGKIIRTAITSTYAQSQSTVLTILGLVVFVFCVL